MKRPTKLDWEFNWPYAESFNEGKDSIDVNVTLEDERYVGTLISPWL